MLAGSCTGPQVLDPADADKFYFDPLDCTKVCPMLLHRDLSQVLGHMGVTCAVEELVVA